LHQSLHRGQRSLGGAAMRHCQEVPLRVDDQQRGSHALSAR